MVDSGADANAEDVLGPGPGGSSIVRERRLGNSKCDGPDTRGSVTATGGSLQVRVKGISVRGTIGIAK